jgi:hypothetical protein
MSFFTEDPHGAYTDGDPLRWWQHIIRWFWWPK